MVVSWVHNGVCRNGNWVWVGREERAMSCAVWCAVLACGVASTVRCGAVMSQIAKKTPLKKLISIPAVWDILVGSSSRGKNESKKCAIGT